MKLNNHAILHFHLKLASAESGQTMTVYCGINVMADKL